MTDIHEKPKMTVGALRKALAGLSDAMPVALEIETDDDLVQADLRGADVEARCDEIDRLYLWASVTVDVEEHAEEPPPDSTRRPVG